MVPSTDLQHQQFHEATLYCTDCGDEHRINGDWIIEVHAESLGYECPACGTTIESNRDGADLTTQSHGALRFQSEK